MSDLDRAYDLDNLRRAWRWIKSNPEATYKTYCRSLYTAYAVADEPALSDLRDCLRRRLYVPSHSTKIYFPKPSGIVRPYSILTVQDQIVYQAMVNIVAEKLVPRVRRRYLTEVFGHLYAGKTGPFFYRKWDYCYRQYNEACRKAFADGFVYGASFDLTACYDSLDHGVLRHFLRKIGCDGDFVDLLIECLSRWTATNHCIYHNHGIPQGPLSSGLLAEVVLQHFDDHCGSPRQVRYMRYVDDFRFFAKSSDILRRRLIGLDTLSKDIGLFPQSSKVHIHRIRDIEEELKSISNPPEPVVKPKVVDQTRLRRRLVELTPRHRVSNATRFKYLLACAEPSAKLNERLWRIYENHPDLYRNIFRYFQGYKTLPRRVAERLVSEIERLPLYHAVHREMVITAEGRLNDHFQLRMDRAVKRLWKPSGVSPDLLVALGRIAIRRGLLTYSQVRYAVRNVKDWWARSQLLEVLNAEIIGVPSLDALLNEVIRHDEEGDVCMMGASAIAEKTAHVRSPIREIKRRAAIVLRAYGLIRRAPRGMCGIEHAMTNLLGKGVAGINWQRFFGERYRHAERQAVSCRALAETNITAWVPAMDVFDDLLLNALYQRDTSLGGYKLGSMGSVFTSTRLKANYPRIFALAKDIHEKRLESELAHPVVYKTGKPTGRIKYGYIRKAKRLMRAALIELKAKL